MRTARFRILRLYLYAFIGVPILEQSNRLKNFVEIGDFYIDFAAHKVFVNKREIHHASKKFDLFAYFERKLTANKHEKAEKRFIKFSCSIVFLANSFSAHLRRVVLKNVGKRFIDELGAEKSGRV